MIKFVLYLLVVPITIWAIDSININAIFKNNKDNQAKIFYVLLIFSISYLVCNFLYDFLYIIK